jgi:hypothetical protein
MFGSERTSRNSSNGDIDTSTSGASAVSSVASAPPDSVTVRPSISAISSAVSVAIRSITSSSSASCASTDTASRTASSAHSTFRSRSRAMVRMYAAASLIALLRTSSGSSVPSPLTGVAAPMVVLGAMAATCAARVM